MVTMVRRETRNGPDGQPYNMLDNKEFAAWESAWEAHQSANGIHIAPVEALNVERPAHRGANLPVDPVRSARFAEAVEFIRDYVGTFGLIKDLRAHPAFGTAHYRLSDRQIEVVLASKARDVERAKPRTQTGRDLTALPYGRTCAAVDNDSGGLTFLLIDRPADIDRYKNPSKWAGWVFVKQQQGPNEVRLGSQRPGESYVGQWANLIDKVLADPMAAVQRYGTELGVCGICQLPLTNAESRAFGIGPVCRSKLAEGLA